MKSRADTMDVPWADVGVSSDESSNRILPEDLATVIDGLEIDALRRRLQDSESEKAVLIGTLKDLWCAWQRAGRERDELRAQMALVAT